MRRNGCQLLITLLMLGFCGCAFGQEPQQLQQIYSNISAQNPVPQSVEGGMWRTDQAFDSVLHIKNVLLTDDLQVAPSLLMADGYVLQLPSMMIPAAGVVSVNITDTLRHMDASAQAHRSVYGMAGVSYSWKWPGALMASIQNIDESAMLTFHSSLQSDRANAIAATKQREKTQVVNGAWWKPYDDAGMFLFFGNASDYAKAISLTMLSNKGVVLGTKQLLLSPRASIFIDAFQLLERPPERGDVGSLMVTANGPDRSLVLLGGIEDDTNGFSANLHLYEQHTEEARNKAVGAITMATPGVMLGKPQKDMQFPVSTLFQPYMLLHNASKELRSLQLFADYKMQGRQRHELLGSVQLRPSAVERFKFPVSLTGLSPDLGTISISSVYRGIEGDIQVEVGSVDGTGNYVFEAETHIENPTVSRTICYWSVQNDTDTMISLWNYSAASQNLLLTFYYQGGRYLLPIQLAAGEQSEVSVATLLHKEIPDQTGKVLPSNLTEGSAILSNIDGEDKRIDLASSTSTFNVRNGTCTNSCGTCNGVTNVYVNPSTVQLVVNDSLQTQGYVTYNTGSNYNVTSQAPWSTANSTVMTISSPGMMAAVGQGNTTGSFLESDQPVGLGYVCMGNSFSCPYSNYTGSAPVQAQVPSYIKVNTDSTVTQNCPVGSQQVRTVNYNIIDTQGYSVTGPLSIYETVSATTTSSCTNSTIATTSSCSRIQTGNYNDVLNSGCPNTAQLATSGCGFTYPDQDWRYCPVNGGSTVNLGDVGKDIVLNNSISLGGNTTSFPKGQTFPHQ